MAAAITPPTDTPDSHCSHQSPTRHAGRDVRGQFVDSAAEQTPKRSDAVSNSIAVQVLVIQSSLSVRTLARRNETVVQCASAQRIHHVLHQQPRPVDYAGVLGLYDNATSGCSSFWPYERPGVRCALPDTAAHSATGISTKLESLSPKEQACCRFWRSGCCFCRVLLAYERKRSAAFVLPRPPLVSRAPFSGCACAVSRALLLADTTPWPWLLPLPFSAVQSVFFAMQYNHPLFLTALPPFVKWLSGIIK